MIHNPLRCSTSQEQAHLLCEIMLGLGIMCRIRTLINSTSDGLKQRDGAIVPWLMATWDKGEY